MIKYDDIQEFLIKYPKMTLLPYENRQIVIEGSFECRAQYKYLEEFEISYKLKIEIPDAFPNKLPRYFLIDNKIEQDIDLHIQDKKEICLGTPLSLMIELNKNPSICGYTKTVLIPFLYGLTYEQKYDKFPFPEVEHFQKGLISEYKNLLKLDNIKSIYNALKLLGMEKEKANFSKCPCGCSNPYLACTYRQNLEKYRFITTPEWFLEEADKVIKKKSRKE